MLLSVLILTGCENTTTPELIMKADKKCETNGGTKFYFIRSSDSGISVTCNNGAYFRRKDVLK